MPAPASEETRQEWKNRIEEQRQSNLSIKQWCLKHQISTHVFSYWRDKLFPTELKASSFTQLPVKRTQAISLQTQGLHIRIDSQCDPILRIQLLALLMEIPC
jgi:hypothetical protein